MVSYLIDKLKDTAYTVAAASALGLGAIYGCGDNGVEPVNYDPQITLEASPTSGMVPLESTIQYVCTDRNGPEDIAESRLNVGSYTSGTTSLDSTFTFTKPGTPTADAYCRDQGGKEVRAGPIHFEVSQPPVNQSPQITQFEFSPLSGVSPLHVRGQYKCEDLDGPDDIAESRLVVGKDTLTTTSLDSTFTFTGPGTYTADAYCRDQGGKEVRAGPLEVEVSSHSVEVRDSVNVRYTATLTNVNRATLNVKNGNTLIFADTITTPTYTKDLGDIPRDNHFILTPDGMAPDTVTAAITNYKPTMDLEGLEADVDEESQIIVDLEGRTSDVNPEDNPVPIISATSLEGRVTPTLNGYLLTLLAGNSLGPYEVEIRAGSEEGGMVTDTLRGEVLEVPVSQDQIAFGGNRINSRDHIFLGDLIDNQLTNIQKLTDYDPIGPGLPDDYHPAWSPDGSKIAFTSFRDGSPAIYIMNADGSNQTRLTGDLRLAWEPDWSPDGSKIAFSYIDSSLAGIGIINTDGSGFTKLHKVPCLSSCNLPSSASWSPDGSKIVFDSNVSGNWEVHVMNADGSNQKNITNHSAIDAMPEWSPDGSKIAFVSLRGNGSLDLYLMNPDGSNPRRLTSDPGAELHPSFSPDGSIIIFAHSRNYNPQIYLMNTDGTGEWTQLTTGRPNSAPAWRPRQ